MSQDISIISLDIFDDAHDGPYHNEGAGEVKYAHVFFPGNKKVCRPRGRGFPDAHMEYGGCDHEDAEKTNLYQEPNDDDVLSAREVLASHQGAACGGGKLRQRQEYAKRQYGKVTYRQTV